MSKFFRYMWLACWLTLAGLFGYFALSGNDSIVPVASLEATTVSVPVDEPEQTIAIENIRPGQRVAGSYSHGEMAGETNVDPTTWRLLTLRAVEVWPDGTIDEINVITLQSPEWIANHNAEFGQRVPLPLELLEMGLPEHLEAEIVAIEACPEIEEGLGRVVLTTVNHLNNDVYELDIVSPRGKHETIRPTGLHKFYRDSDDAWVSAKELQAGDHLQGPDGMPIVRSIQKIPGVHRVYNMTVEGEHVYRVSTLGALVHNNGCAADPKHHVFPQEFRHEFEDGLNIPIDDYTLPLPQRRHIEIHPEWNGRWQEFFDDFSESGSTPTPNSAQDFATELIGEFDLDQFGPFVPSR